MKYSLIITLTIFLPATILAQVLPGPDGSAAIRNMNLPVNLYNGVMTIPVPLYTVSANNGFEVPVALEYSASGSRVSEIASSVGLGWRLIAGGSITRVVNDEPDEQSAYYGDDLDIDELHLKFGIGAFAEPIDAIKDHEKDVFYFNHPGGNGKFIDMKEVTDTGGGLGMRGFRTLPSTDTKIEFDNVQNKWVLTDKFGNRFTFGATADSREVTSIELVSKEDGVVQSSKARSYVTSWMLTEILPAGLAQSQAITFTYESNTADSDMSYSTESAVLHSVNENNTLTSKMLTTEQNFTIDPANLTKIQFPKGEVDFSYTSRGDVQGGARLTGFVVKDKQDNVVKKVGLNQSYFNAANSFLQGGSYGSCNTYQCKRLKLESVTENGSISQSYTYLNEYTEPENYHSGGAHKYELPPRNSYYHDAYGFYNGGPHQGNNYEIYTDAPPAIPGFTNGMDRSIQLYAKANILKDITYRSGATTHFDYNVLLWGVQVSQVVHKDENGALVAGNSYVYGSASQYPSPTFTTLHNGISRHFSHAIGDVNNLGTSRGFGTVTITDLTGNGSRKVDFHVWSPNTTGTIVQAWNSNTKSIQFFEFVGKESGVIKTLSSQSPPYSTHSLDDYSIGQVKKETFYDANGGIARTREYNYEHGSVYKTVKNHFFAYHGSSVTYGHLQLPTFHRYETYVSEYDIKIRVFRLDDVVETVYENGSVASGVTTNYSYSPAYATVLRSVITSRTDGLGGESFNKRTGFYYPVHAPNFIDIIHSQSTLENMVTKNMVAVPVQVETELKLPSGSYRTVEATTTTFKEENGLINPFQTWSLSVDEPVAVWSASDYDLVETKSYNADGLLESVTGIDGITATNAYDSEGYLTSRTVNPGSGLPSRTTVYTYRPLIGVETTTDPNGRTITHEYDSQNRLYLTRDQDGYILQRYRYNDLNENTDLGATIQIIGGNIVGISQTIKAENVTGYGGTSLTDFKWNIENSMMDGPSVQHTFGSVGSHEITLFMVNPEYDEPEKITASKTFYAAEWEPSVIFGPSVVCLDGTGGEPFYTANDFFSASPTIGGFECHEGHIQGFDWEYSYNQSSWSNFPNNTEPGITFPASLAYTSGTLYMRVKMSDNCGNTKTSPIKSVNVTADICDGTNPPPPSCTITASVSSKTFNENGGSSSFTVALANTSSFSVTDNQGWITTVKSGNTVNINVSSTTNSRSGVITVTGTGGCTDTVNIVQNGPSNDCPVGCFWNPLAEQCEGPGGSPCAQ